MPVRGVLFDVDGTLIGLRPAPEVFYQQVCRENGLPCAEVLDRARALAVAFVTQHGLDYLDDERAMWREANRQVFLSLGAGERAAACAARFQELFTRDAHSYLYPDVLPTLEGLQARGLLLGALTGRLHSSEAELVELGVRSRFVCYLYAGELAVLKPDPRLYRAALDRIGLPAAAVLLVGDQPADAEGARSAGMPALLIVRQGQRPVAGVDSIGDLRQLPDRLDGKNGPDWGQPQRRRAVEL